MECCMAESWHLYTVYSVCVILDNENRFGNGSVSVRMSNRSYVPKSTKIHLQVQTDRLWLIQQQVGIVHVHKTTCCRIQPVKSASVWQFAPNLEVKQLVIIQQSRQQKDIWECRHHHHQAHKWHCWLLMKLCSVSGASRKLLRLDLQPADIKSR